MNILNAIKFLKVSMKRLVPLIVFFLFSCSAPDTGVPLNESSDVASPVAETEPVIVSDNKPDPFLRIRIIADILYEASYAFDDNKLLLPAGDNAYDRYQEVLSVDPGNQVAIEGIKAIVIRYVELADEAMLIGKYDNAAAMLDRAASIDPGSDAIFAGLSRLEEARLNKVEFYELSPDLLSEQSIDVMILLAEIADMVKQSDATVLITARTDEEGRWIYKIMRESVGGYRLRGNISLGNVPGVQINSSESRI